MLAGKQIRHTILWCPTHKESARKKLSDFNKIFAVARERETRDERTRIKMQLLWSMARKRQPTENRRKKHHQLCVHIVLMGTLKNISATLSTFQQIFGHFYRSHANITQLYILQREQLCSVQCCMQIIFPALWWDKWDEK